MTYQHNDPSTWLPLRPLIIAHDVGHSRDRSTAVVGGNSPMPPRLLGIVEHLELPQGLYGSARANALEAVDRGYNHSALIVADLSYDPTYGEILYETFRKRLIGLQITRHGDGMTPQFRAVGSESFPIYTIGRSYLLDLYLAELQSQQVRIIGSPTAKRAHEQLVELETEFRDTGIVYSCPSGRHDDLGISCAMLAWAARHQHLPEWTRLGLGIRQPIRRQQYSWKAFT